MTMHGVVDDSVITVTGRGTVIDCDRAITMSRHGITVTVTVAWIGTVSTVIVTVTVT